MIHHHPISQIFKLILTEKEFNDDSKPSINNINDTFNIKLEDIDEISNQLTNHNKISEVIPTYKFMLDFNPNKLKEILEQKKIFQNKYYLILSFVAWLIQSEKSLNFEYFDLILDILNNFPETIGTHNILSIYELTNYIFECFLRTNIEYQFDNIKNQIRAFLNHYILKDPINLFNDTFIIWLKISYSFENQTNFSKNLLMLAAEYIKNHNSSSSKCHLNDIYAIIEKQLFHFNELELSFLAEISQFLTQSKLINYITSLLLSKSEIQYKLFDKNNYPNSDIYLNISKDFSESASYLLQFSSFQFSFSKEIYIFPVVEVDSTFLESSKIKNMTNYLLSILEKGLFNSNELFSFLNKLLKDCLSNEDKHQVLFDLIAVILSLIPHLDKYDSTFLFQDLIDSPLFDSQITIFTENSQNEAVHGLRMMAYFLLVFLNESNIQLFLSKKKCYPLMISEFFYYASGSKKNKYKIPNHILESETFLSCISSTIYSYIKKEFFNKDQNSNVPEISTKENKISNETESIQKDDKNEESNALTDKSSISESNKPDSPLTERKEPKSEEIEKYLNEPEMKKENSFNESFTDESAEAEYNSKEIYRSPKGIKLADFNSTSAFSNSSHFNSNSSINFPNESELFASTESQINLNMSSETYESFDSDDFSNSAVEFPPASSDKTRVHLSSNKMKSLTQSQSSQLKIKKIQHRLPIDDSSNPFLKWFNALITYKSINNLKNTIKPEKYIIDDYLQCPMIYILCFISKAIDSDEEIALTWGKSPLFIPTIFSLLYNEYIRPNVLTILLKIWHVKHLPISQEMKELILFVLREQYDEDFALLDFQLMEIINNYLLNSMHFVIEKYEYYDDSLDFMNDRNLLNLIEPFNDIYPCITSMLANYDISSDFLHASLIFFSFYAKTINKTARAAISSALMRVEGKEPDKKFYHDFILIITSFNNSNESPEFLITQPKMISTFIQSFSESQYLKDVLSFIKSLCEHSIENTFLCHNGNVDIAIIKYILKHKESELVSDALSLFSKIAILASSIPVVNQFISLLCPIKSHFLPPYIIECIKTLSNIISMKYNQPTIFLPISKKSPYIQISKLNGSKINQGFTFVANLFIDNFSQKSKSRLLYISDKDRNLYISICNAKISISESNSGGITQKVTFNNKIPTNKWTQIAVSFVPNLQNSPVYFAISNQNCSKSSFLLNSFHGNLTCEIGNVKEWNVSMHYATLIESFSLYPNKNDINSDLKSFDSLLKIQNKDSSGIMGKFDVKQSLLDVELTQQSDLTASLVGGNLITKLSFSDVFGKFFKAEIFIPLFAQIGFPVYSSNPNSNEIDKSKDFTKNHAKLIFDLFYSTLVLSDELKNSFCEIQGFRIISFLLMNVTDLSALSYDLYMHFYTIFQEIKHNKLKVQLLQDILLNFQIWSLSSPDTYQNILGIWTFLLAGKDVDDIRLFLSVCPFSKLIRNVSVFYQIMNYNSDNTQKIEQNFADAISTPISSDDDNTRKLIIDLLFNVANLKFTENDFDVLLMTIISPQSGYFIYFSIDLLILMDKLADLPNSPLLQPNIKYKIISLDILLKYKEEIVLLVIKTILKLHEKNIIDLKESTHIEIMMMNINAKMACESFLSSLFRLSKDQYPNALPIPFYLILKSLSDSYSKSNEEFLENKYQLLSIIVKNLQPNPKYKVITLWYIWPLIFAIKNQEILKPMLHFIILSSMKDWMVIFASIFIISTCLDVDPIPIQRSFLISLANYFKDEDKEPADITGFFDLAIFFIMYKPIQKESALEKAYNKSIFKELIEQEQHQEGEKNEQQETQVEKEGQKQQTQQQPQKEIQGQQKEEESKKEKEKYQQDEFFDEKDFIIKMKEFTDSKIEFKYMFDLGEDEEWNDKDLCVYLAQVWDKYSQNDQKIIKYKPFIKYINYKLHNENELDSIDRSLLLEEIYKNLIQEFMKSLCIELKRVSAFSLKNKITAIKHYNQNNKSIDFMCNFSHIWSNLYNYSINKYKQTSNELWHKIWRSLTNDRSPWRNSLPSSETYYRRNNRILKYFCPMKLKQNLNYTNHKDASFNREYGSSDIAKEKLKIYQKALNEKLKKEAPPPILSNSNYPNYANNNSFDGNDICFNVLNISEAKKYYINNYYPRTYQYKFSHYSSNQSQISNLSNDSKKAFSSDAKLLTLSGPKKIEISMHHNRFCIIYKKDDLTIDKSRAIRCSSISHILLRSFRHLGKTFEIITKNGRSYLIDLKKENSLKFVIKLKENYKFPNALIQTLPPKQFIESLQLQEEWCKGHISNFEYLMKLNFYGGRSFNETSIYPIFPWIINDYSSSKIDLADPKIYRDLSLPMGALNKDRINELKSHAKDYASFRNVGFLYNSCYISPLCVYLWLIRVEPFTSLHIDLQSGRFDYASRIFTSIPAAYNMVNTHMNDYRELIPEFFYTSTFLENRNHFDLGTIHNKNVNDVILPNWAKSAIEFIYIHRKALESEYVNNHLNQWIDLIFGYCQKGQEAIDKDNTFDPCLYEDIWSEENLNDENQRKMIKAVLRHCGHIPNQLFDKPHPIKERYLIEPICDTRTYINKIDRCINSKKNLSKPSFVKMFTDKSRGDKSCLFVSKNGCISIGNIRINTSQESETNQSAKKQKPRKSFSSSILNIIANSTDDPSSNLTSSNNDSNKIEPPSFHLPQKTIYDYTPEDCGSFNLALSTTSEKLDNYAFNPNNRLLIFATNIGSIIITQLLETKSSEYMLTRHVGQVNCVAISDHFIVSGGSDTSINIWSLSEDIQLSKVKYESTKFLLPTEKSGPAASIQTDAAQPNSENAELTDFHHSPNTIKYKVIDDTDESDPLYHKQKIQSFRDEITCIDINEEFGTIASGTKDGSIILIDTKKLELTKSIDIAPEIPIMVKITSGWGFVIVYSSKEHEGHIKSYLTVFDIDGQFIRKKQIYFEISSWTQFTSVDGFDYMVVGSINEPYHASRTQASNSHRNENLPKKKEKFNLFMFEVFFLDVEDAGVDKNKSKSKFVDLHYSVDEGVLYAVNEERMVHVYSVNDLNTSRFKRTIFGYDS